ncbi:3-oxoacyl-[acyl-carrier-protein] synthase, mitochondrial [Culicoides brevitarsis]|uniref:3-oxoacyl-[acyl-carrier-protein] synthase, mitochondrial n=1 Tax=Culicoides brevitarsis TaxID=469753 RepID=UPI00307B43CF
MFYKILFSARKSFSKNLIHNYSSQNVQRRRVVVTGLGIISPLGNNVSTSWKKLISGECAIQRLHEKEYIKLPCHVAARLSDIELHSMFSKSDMKSMSISTMYAIAATEEALKTSNWYPNNEVDKQRTGVAVGMGMIDFTDVCDTYEALKLGYNRVSPFFVPRILSNMAAGQISIRYGFQGPNHSVSTACATGAHSIGDAFRFICHGDAEVMIAGATEACINPLSIAGFCRLRALSTSKNPKLASRPFDKSRDGFVMGEGSAILVLEELHHAKQRNANILAEILGYGVSGDASHLTAPREDGNGAVLVMSRAMSDAGIKPKDVTYINAHATSTPIGDIIEAKSIKKLFKHHCKTLKISSSKGAHGHLLGSAGNLEVAFTVMAIKDKIIPPTIGFDTTEDEIADLNFVPNEALNWPDESKMRIALKNSFGFGGTNACICISEYIP